MTPLSDLRLGVRSLARTPGFTLAAALTLALGIGLATAVYTVADALLLRRLPVVAQERLVVLSGSTRDGRMESWPLTLEQSRELAGTTRALADVAFVSYYGAAPVAVREAERVSRLRTAMVSGDYFAVLGARPLVGRALRPADDVRGAAPVLVLSHRAWRERYGGAPDVVGRRVVSHGTDVEHTIVGVMPPGLDHPRGVEAWGAVLAATPPGQERFVALHAVGRLADGAMPAEAEAELTRLFRQEGAPAPLRDLHGVARALPELVLGDVRPAVVAFAAASALLLLITCVNVANLLVVRGLARGREVAVRAALGASRGRVVRQLLAEHVVLAAVGGALGLMVAAGAVRLFVALAPAGLPRLDAIRLDLGILGGAAAITIGAMLLFAVAPALVASRVELQGALRTGSRNGATRGSRLASEALVASQVALALLVLSAAALVGRSLLRLERADLAFDADRLLVAELALRTTRYAGPAEQRAMLDGLLPAVRALPGVRAATPVVAAPFSGASGWDGRLAAEGQSAEDAATNPVLNMELVDPSYFATFDVAAQRGRLLTDADRDGAPPVVVLSASAARRFWGDADPIGRRVTLGPNALTVVGVVADTRWRDLREARPSVYFPLAQSVFPFAPTTLAIRTIGDPLAVVAGLRGVLAEAAPDVALASAAPFEQHLAAPLAQPRLNALLLAVFAGAAVLLATVGLVGVLATMVRQRTRELGVRMAVGATAGDVARLVLRRGLLVAAIGCVAGLLAALAANRLLAAMLYEVSPTDLPTLLLAAVALVLVAGLASLLPARSSARIEPSVALRAD